MRKESKARKAYQEYQQKQKSVNKTKHIVKEWTMQTKNIVYFHGLSSSGQSTTGKKLRELFPENNVITPDIPVKPKEALTYLRCLTKDLNPEYTIIVGTSMGGMYAQQMTGFKRILINPAFHVSNTLKSHIGQKLPFFYPREDGKTEFDVTERLVKKFEEMEANQFDNATDP